MLPNAALQLVESQYGRVDAIRSLQGRVELWIDYLDNQPGTPFERYHAICKCPVCAPGL